MNFPIVALPVWGLNNRREDWTANNQEELLALLEKALNLSPTREVKVFESGAAK